MKTFLKDLFYFEHQKHVKLFKVILKSQDLKSKNIINTTYLIMVLLKMKLLIFLVFSQYALACKYGIIFQIPLYN